MLPVDSRHGGSGALLPAYVTYRVSAAQRHQYPMAWAQGENRIRFDGMARHEMQPILLCDRSQHQGHFHQRELLADALAWPSAEGKIGVAWTVR